MIDWTRLVSTNGVEVSANTPIYAQLHHLSDTVDDLRKRLDQSEGRVTAQLSDQRPRGIWKRIFG